MVKVARLVEKYIAEHPNVRECFAKGLINYSALTRKIAKDLELKDSFDAILIACRRYYGKVKSKPAENKILKLLKESKLEVKNKIVDVLVGKDVFYNNVIELQKEVKKRGERFNIIEGTKTMTIITSMEFMPYVKKLFKSKIRNVADNLAEVIIKSDQDLIDTPGVIAYISSLLAENGINIIEVMSTYTDTLIVIDEKDIGKVMDVLSL